MLCLVWGLPCDKCIFLSLPLFPVSFFFAGRDAWQLPCSDVQLLSPLHHPRGIPICKSLLQITFTCSVIPSHHSSQIIVPCASFLLKHPDLFYGTTNERHFVAISVSQLISNKKHVSLGMHTHVHERTHARTHSDTRTCRYCSRFTPTHTWRIFTQDSDPKKIHTGYPPPINLARYPLTVLWPAHMHTGYTPTLGTLFSL